MLIMSSNAQSYRLALRVFADFGVTIAVPSVLAALFGKWLDQRLGTSPWLLIVCLTLALMATAVVVVKKAKRYAKEYERL